MSPRSRESQGFSLELVFDAGLHGSIGRRSKLSLPTATGQFPYIDNGHRPAPSDRQRTPTSSVENSHNRKLQSPTLALANQLRSFSLWFCLHSCLLVFGLEGRAPNTCVSMSLALDLAGKFHRPHKQRIIWRKFHSMKLFNRKLQSPNFALANQLRSFSLWFCLRSCLLVFLPLLRLRFVFACPRFCLVAFCLWLCLRLLLPFGFALRDAL